jgi:threonine 3-dehydrogenase
MLRRLALKSLPRQQKNISSSITTTPFLLSTHQQQTRTLAHSNDTKRKERVLITGCLGQIGVELAEDLKRLVGEENVILTDLGTPKNKILEQPSPFYFLDVADRKRLQRLVDKYGVTTVIHNAAFLSATAEKMVEDALELNTAGLHNVLAVAANNNLRVFVPSSIAAFGPTTPLDLVPDLTIQRPTTVYGIGKVYAELLGEYYAEKLGIDFRSLRYPGIISWKSPPGGGTTDYAVHMFYYALEQQPYECYLNPDQPLPMMYMPDCIRATIDFIFKVPQSQLKNQRTYNVTSFSFTPKQLENAIKKYIPNFTVTYKPDFRQGIAETWPREFDDSNARRDWGWAETYQLDAMVRDMLTNLRPIIAKTHSVQPESLERD